LLCFRSVS